MAVVIGDYKFFGEKKSSKRGVGENGDLGTPQEVAVDQRDGMQKVGTCFGEAGDVALFFGRPVWTNEIRVMVRSEPDWQWNLWSKLLLIEKK